MLPVLFRKYAFVSLAVLVAGPMITLAQTRRIDSLKRLVERTDSEVKRSEMLIILCEEFGSMNADSLYTYASAAKRLNTRPQQKDLYKADYYITRSLLKKGAIDSAYSHTVSFLNKMEESNLQNIQAYRMFLGTRANLLIRKGEFKDAIEQYYRLRHTSEKNNDPGFEILATNGIGWAYMEMGRNTEALRFFHEALAKDTRLQMVGINYKDSPDNARRFLGRYGNPFSMVGVDGNGRGSADDVVAGGRGELACGALSFN